MIRAGRSAPGRTLWTAPGLSVASAGWALSWRAKGMRIFEEIHLSIVIAICAFAMGKAIWFALAAAW